MRGKNAFQLILLISFIFNSCTDEERVKTTCDSDLNNLITDQIGRIYYWTQSEPNFYYIGNQVNVSSGVNGGFIPCSDLDSEFKKEGIIVEYSGIDKGSPTDTGDPLFAFIIITNIKVVL